VRTPARKVRAFVLRLAQIFAYTHGFTKRYYEERRPATTQVLINLRERWLYYLNCENQALKKSLNSLLVITTKIHYVRNKQ